MMKNQQPLLRPLFSYAGNKFQVAERFQHLFLSEPQRRYVAPFCGGLGDALRIQPQNALLNDYSAPIICLYSCIQRGEFKFTLHGKGNEQHYYALRDEFNLISFGGTTDLVRAQNFLISTLEYLGDEKGKNKKKCAELKKRYAAFVLKESNLTPEQKHQQNVRWAELIYYILASGYNGLLRANLSGIVNVPCGRPRKKGEIRKYIEDFSPYEQIFKNWEFQSLPFEEVEIKKNDFVYLDPPYAADPLAQKSPHTYSFPFKWADQVRLADWAKRLPVPVVASNAATPEIIDLWCSAGFQIFQTFGKKRLIGQNEESRIVANEVLFYKP
jgi:DNA adenine methylase